MNDNEKWEYMTNFERWTRSPAVLAGFLKVAIKCDNCKLYYDCDIHKDSPQGENADCSAAWLKWLNSRAFPLLGEQKSIPE